MTRPSADKGREQKLNPGRLESCTPRGYNCLVKAGSKIFSMDILFKPSDHKDMIVEDKRVQMYLQDSAHGGMGSFFLGKTL